MARHSADDFIASVIKASVARLAVLQGTRRAESMALGVISDVVQRCASCARRSSMGCLRDVLLDMRVWLWLWLWLWL